MILGQKRQTGTSLEDVAVAATSSPTLLPHHGNPKRPRCHPGKVEKTKQDQMYNSHRFNGGGGSKTTQPWDLPFQNQFELILGCTYLLEITVASLTLAPFWIFKANGQTVLVFLQHFL